MCSDCSFVLNLIEIDGSQGALTIVVVETYYIKHTDPNGTVTTGTYHRQKERKVQKGGEGAEAGAQTACVGAGAESRIRSGAGAD
jgi:hypothetical protein